MRAHCLEQDVRDITAGVDIAMTTGHYLRSMKQLANQWTSGTFRDDRRQRLYLKDMDCPVEWRDALRTIIYPSLFYLNDNVCGAGEDEKHNNDLSYAGITIAPAGDLMSSLPEEMRAENLMCYIGHEGTYTPAHREMCASVGHNIMVEASSNGGGEKAGSSIWFMTESKDREVVHEYFLSMLGHDIEIEKHFAQINAWKKAPFDVYIVEQRAGDFILIPPLAAHQVWNRGTRTMKIAWNRTTVETLELAIREALPKARLVCRDEQYKNKTIVYFTLRKYYQLLRNLGNSLNSNQLNFIGIDRETQKSAQARQIIQDFKRLFDLFVEILVDEAFAFMEKDVEFLQFDSCVTCSYCRSNIFNRFLTCKHCVRTLSNGDEDVYDVCMECYAMGRSCACLSGLTWCEQWPWSKLIENYEVWRSMIIQNDGFIDVQASPQPFEVTCRRSGKKSVAQICQEALRRRPWKDIRSPEKQSVSPDLEQVNDDDKSVKKVKRRRKKGDVRRCHTCVHKDYSYRIHECTNPECNEGYCYGVLYRAFDMMPQKVLEDEHWQCPKCLGICSCGSCRRAGKTNAYIPRSTLLGHDTRQVADDRSVEALVDFRIHNLSWLKAVGEESRSNTSKRMQRLQERANIAKAQGPSHHAGAEQQVQGSTAVPALSDADTSENASDGQYTTGKDAPIVQSDVILELSVRHCRADSNLEAPSTARSETTTDVVKTSLPSYPDPAVFMRQRIGMGYYEQDDTPDKILFDPYCSPSERCTGLPDNVTPDDTKNPRATRRTRSVGQFPDSFDSRLNKKLRFSRQPDTAESMDPALMNVFAASPLFVTEKPGLNSYVRLDQPLKEVEQGTPGWDLRNFHVALPSSHTRDAPLQLTKPANSFAGVEDADIKEDLLGDGPSDFRGQQKMQSMSHQVIEFGAPTNGRLSTASITSNVTVGIPPIVPTPGMDLGLRKRPSATSSDLKVHSAPAQPGVLQRSTAVTKRTSQLTTQVESTAKGAVRGTNWENPIDTVRKSAVGFDKTKRLRQRGVQPTKPGGPSHQGRVCRPRRVQQSRTSGIRSASARTSEKVIMGPEAKMVATHESQGKMVGSGKHMSTEEDSQGEGNVASSNRTNRSGSQMRPTQNLRAVPSTKAYGSRRRRQ